MLWKIAKNVSQVTRRCTIVKSKPQKEVISSYHSEIMTPRYRIIINDLICRSNSSTLVCVKLDECIRKCFCRTFLRDPITILNAKLLEYSLSLYAVFWLLGGTDNWYKLLRCKVLFKKVIYINSGIFSGIAAERTQYFSRQFTVPSTMISLCDKRHELAHNFSL